MATKPPFIPHTGGGIPGTNGTDGESAYELAVANGFVGSEVDWLASLVGPTGSQGPQGLTGSQGPIGLTGPQGIQGNVGPQGNPGVDGTDGTNGVDGESAYQVALDNGFVGDEAAWLASLVGPQGPQGIQGPQGLQGDNLVDWNVEYFSGNGVTVNFPLAADPGSKNNTFVTVHGVDQNLLSYTLVGQTITLSEAPPTGTNNVQIRYGGALVTSASSYGNRICNHFSGTGVDTTEFTLSVAPGSENNTDVTITGITQHKGTYSVVGNILKFFSATPVGTNNIQVMISGLGTDIGVPGDGTITAGKLTVNAINGQAAETSLASGDEFLVHDISDNALNKVTLANLLAGLNTATTKSLASNGYAWVGPILVQWGSTAAIANSTTGITVTYPIPFPTACVFATFTGTGTRAGTSEANNTVTNRTTTSMGIAHGYGATQICNWLAIGY